jgi:PAS domain S-box-containing protein
LFPVRAKLSKSTVIFTATVFAMLVLSRDINYPLFHTLAEFYSIIVACCIFVISWNSRKLHENGFFIFLGVASISVAAVDLLHTLAYKGMTVLPGGGAPLATQLWIGGRYLQSVSAILAFFFLRRQLRDAPLVAGFVAFTGSLLASIFIWHVFPACYVEGAGLTPFKIYSEYVIIMMFALSLFILCRERESFDPRVARLIAASFVAFIAGELALTRYISVFGPANEIGHLFKIAGFYCLYRGVIVTGVSRPIDLLFRDLRESEERYRNLYNNTPVMLHSIDYEGRIVGVSAYWLALLGYDREDVIGRRLVDFLSEESRSRAENEILPQFFRTGFCSDVPYMMRRKNGEMLNVLLSASAERDERGGIIRSLAVMVDVTDRKRAEEEIELLNVNLATRAYQLSIANEELADLTRTLEERVRREVAKNREKDSLLVQQSRQAAMGEMIGNIAHQWRQPLNAISLLVQDLSLCCESGELSREYMDRSVAKVVELVMHMSQTIDDFRDFFRPDREKMPFMLREVIGKSLSLIEGSLREHGISVELAQEEDLVAVGYPNQFAQVIINIVNNARDAFVEQGTTEPNVRIEYFREENRPVVIIRDNAGGIPDEIIDRIFEPYFTTKEPGKGTGIGLSMCRTIIEENMGGSIRVRNVENGTVFRLDLQCRE